MRLRGMMLGAVMAVGMDAHADEGMWLPSQLPGIAGPMAKAGFKGDPRDLADLTKPPLSAVVRIGGGTGAFVSAEGLVVTNHHVAFSVIQYNAKPDRDLITDGYVAHGRGEEMPASPDYRLRVTVGFDKVTDTILARAQGKKGRAYFDAVDDASKALVAACEAEEGTRCSVANMFYGTDFYLVRQLELRDLRLVYAPPRAIGNYGDEIDNFMWPRHAGDFTVLRAYVGKDGKPADYSPDNRPYHPPAHLQIAREGVAEGDFVMLAGYPGITYRHRTAAEFADQVQWRLPTSIAVLTELQEVIEASGKTDKQAALRYAAQLQSLKNGIKRFTGELEGLQRSDAVDVRAADEAAMLAWLAKRPEGANERAGIDEVAALLANGKRVRERDVLLGVMQSQTQLMRAALNLDRLAIERTKADMVRESGYQQRDEELIRSQLKQVTRRFDPAVEKALLASVLRRYQTLPDDARVPEFDRVFGRDPASLKATLERVYAATRLGDEAARIHWFDAKPTEVLASDDALLALARALQPAFLRIDGERKDREGDLLRLRPAYMKALVAYREQQGKAVYPDANSTLRVSFGKVTPLDARDAVHYSAVTTVEGIVQKNTGRAPFDAPAPLLAAIAKGDFGRYVDPKLGKMPVNFLSNLDTTGGNSGSPVLNARGELVGLNFDSNWEAVSASWMYDPRYKRAIHVDMRYMRWLMDNVYPSHELLSELGLPTDQNRADTPR